MTEEQDKKLQEPNSTPPDMIQQGENLDSGKNEDTWTGEIKPGRQLTSAGPGQGGEIEEGPLQPEHNLLELIYGVLFDPGRTFEKIAANPPLWQSVIIYAIITVLSGAMGIFINLQNLPIALSGYPAAAVHIVQGMLPVVAMFTVLWQFVKWFVYSAFLHLLADFYGGRGTARGVFTVYGLAALPTLFIIPVQFISLAVLPNSGWLRVLIIVVSLAISFWGVILLVMGIREVHRFSTGKSVAVVLTPLLVILALILIAVVAIISAAATMSSPPMSLGPYL